MTALEPCPLLIGERWVHDHGCATVPLHNPSTGETLAAVPLCGEREVDRAVRAALAVAPAWQATPAVDRARVMFRYQAILNREADALARLIAREEGKTFAEARGSVQRGIEVVEFASGAPALLMGETLPDLSRGMDSEVVREPVGVCAGITPFNFPAMVPLWMFPLALVCGNTFVLKPSEQAPLTAIRLGALLLEAGAPPGVFNLVHGQQAAVDALLTHPRISAVSFVGSSAVARHVYTTAAAHGKRVQAAGGAKNFLVIMPDADLEAVVDGVTSSAFGCAGERCMAASIAVPIGRSGDAVVEALAERARRLRVGRVDVGPSDVEMGPLVSAPHLERVRAAIATAVDTGAVAVADGRGLRVADAPGGYYLGPTILDRVLPEMPAARQEIFGPVLSVVRAGDLESAIGLIAQSGYGNGASIFTRSGAAARTFARQVDVGMVGINVGLPAAPSLYPFAGRNGSFFGDLHVQGREGIAFYTRQKLTLSRWPT